MSLHKIDTHSEFNREVSLGHRTTFVIFPMFVILTNISSLYMHEENVDRHWLCSKSTKFSQGWDLNKNYCYSKLKNLLIQLKNYFLQWPISNSLIPDFLIQSILFYYFHFEIILYYTDCSGLLTKMLTNLPVEIILLICEYPEFKELKQLARTNKRMMGIIKKHLPILLEGKILFYRRKLCWKLNKTLKRFIII